MVSTRVDRHGLPPNAICNVVVGQINQGDACWTDTDGSSGVVHPRDRGEGERGLRSVLSR